MASRITDNQDWQDEATRLETQYGLSPGTLKTVAELETGGGTSKMTSPKGAQGLMQFMPKTAIQYGVDVNDHMSSTRGAAKYLGELKKRYGGDEELAMAAYNYGMGNVDKQRAASRSRGGDGSVQSLMDLGLLPEETHNYIVNARDYRQTGRISRLNTRRGMTNIIAETRAGNVEPIPLRSPSELAPVEGPSFGQTWSDNVTVNNSIYNAFANPDRGERYDRDETFDPADFPKYSGQEHLLDGALSEQHADDRLKYLENYNAAKARLSQADGWNQVGAALTNPDWDVLGSLAIAPFTGGASTLPLLTRVATAGVQTAAVGAALSAGKELSLVATTPKELDAKEILTHTAFGAAAGGVVGAAFPAGKHIASALLGRSAKAMTPAQQTEVGQSVGNALHNSPANQSVGAAQVVPMNPADLAALESIDAAEEVVITALNKVPGVRSVLGSPGQQMATSEITASKQAAQRLTTDHFHRGKNKVGIASELDTENAIKQEVAQDLGSYAKGSSTAYKEFKKLKVNGDELADEFVRAGVTQVARTWGRGLGTIDDVRANPSQFMTRGNFELLIDSANRFGDTSVFSQVERVAKHGRVMYDKYSKGALDNGLLDDVVRADMLAAERTVIATNPLSNQKTALTQSIDREKYLRDLAVAAGNKADEAAANARLTVVSDALVKVSARLRLAVDTARTSAQNNILQSKTAQTYAHRMWNHQAIENNPHAFREMIRKHFANEPNVDDIVDDITASFSALTKPTSMNGLSLIGKAAPLKEKLLLIPDDVVAPFTINNASRKMERYISEMSTDIHFKMRHGGKNMEIDTDLIRADAAEMRRVKTAELQAASASEQEINKAIKKINTQEALDIKNLMAMAKTVAGETADFFNPSVARAINEAKRWNAVTMLGFQVISNLVDLGKIVGTHGVQRFMPLMTKHLGTLTSSGHFRKMLNEQGEQFAYGTAYWTGRRMEELGDYVAQEVSQTTGLGGKLYGVYNSAANNFSVLNGMQRFTSFSKVMAGQLNSDKILRLTSKFDSLSAKEKQWLAQHYIDETMAKKIAAEFAQHGEKSGQNHFANTDLWSDSYVGDTLKQAVWKATHKDILTPSAGNLPNVMRNQWGGLMFQFQSFLGAAMQDLIISGVGQRDMATVGAFLGIAFMSAAVVQAKSFLKTGEFVEMDDTFLRNVIDASGLAGTLQRSALWGYDMLADTDESKKFRGVSNFNSILGPTVGRSETVYKAFNDFTEDGQMSDTTKKKLFTLFPYQNLWYMRSAFDAVNREHEYVPFMVPPKK